MNTKLQEQARNTAPKTSGHIHHKRLDIVETALFSMKAQLEAPNTHTHVASLVLLTTAEQ